MFAALAACFSPSPPAGLPCSPEGDCPEGQSCQTGVCVLAEVDAGDDGADARIDGVPGCPSWIAPNVGDTCTLPPPNGVQVVFSGSGGWNIDTDQGTIRKGSNRLFPSTLVMTQPGSEQQVRVFVLDDLVLPSNYDLTATGMYPVVLVVFGDVVIDGPLNVSADFTVSANGASADECTIGASPTASGGTGTGGGGGGAGGTYAATGGNGGNGAGDTVGGTAGIGGTVGAQFGQASLEPLLAGCRGQNGSTGASGGAGGALQISALGSITISSSVTANGGGGLGGAAKRGGGGGGSGGAILLEAEHVILTQDARVAANGGGGGGGGNATSSGGSGGAGRIDGQRAGGGSSPSGGGSGGSGGAATTPAGNSGNHAATSSAGGGGGGGGSVGRILIRGRSSVTIDPSAIVSPPPAP